MILRSIELENFGRFKGESIEFRRGMNLVIGPNEAGKSTLAEAVPAVLFGTNRLEKFKTWGRNACSATLFFEGGGRTIQVKRNLLTDEVELVEKDDLYHVLSHFSGKAPLRGRSASCKEYRALVESLLGVGDDRLFRATYFFGHYPQEWTGDELAQNLRTLVSGTAEADYAEILDGLLEEHFNLTCSNPWGRDKQKPREYENICEELETSDVSDAVPVFVEIDETADLTEQIDTLSAELVHARLEHEKGLRYIEHVRSQLEAPVDKVEENEAPPSAAPTQTPSSEDDVVRQLVAAGLPENLPKELPEILDEAGEIRQEMAALQQPYSLLNSREKRVPVVPWVLLGGVLLVCAVFAGISWWGDISPLLVSVAAGFVAVATLGYGVWKHLVRKKALADCEQQRGRLDQKKFAAQTKQAELSERCDALGLPSSPIDLVRLQKLVTTNQELLARYWRDDSAADDLELVQEVPKAENREVDPAPTKVEENPEIQELEARMVEFEVDMRAKEQRLVELKQQQEGLASSHTKRSLSGGSALQQRKRELEEQIAILRAAVNLLAGAVEDFGASHLVKLNQEAGRLFGKITAGRYRDIRLDENMVPSVKVDGRRWVSVDNFSRGTVDAIYLALRIALAKVRDDGRSLPLMLDDPFVHLDHKRLAKALNMIDMASADGQLILFSHNMELGKRAARERWHVVPLDGETVDIPSEEGGDHAGQLHLL